MVARKTEEYYFLDSTTREKQVYLYLPIILHLAVVVSDGLEYGGFVKDVQGCCP